MKAVFIFLSFILFGQACAQEKPIYVLKNRYDQHVNEVINNSPIDFREIRILVNYQIVDANNSSAIDYKRVKSWLDKFYPNKRDEGILCVNLENRFYNDLKNNGTKDYKTANKEFVTLLDFIKDYRPNVEIGVWGLPFLSSDEQMDPIFEASDIIFPSCYIPAPAEIDGIQSNYDFLDGKMDKAFSYADRLNKKVIPFFWYLVHGPDKDLRFERLSKEEMFKYVKYVENYRSANQSEILGVAWWDTPTPYNSNRIKDNFRKSERSAIRALSTRKAIDEKSTIDDTFLYYFDF